MPKMAKSYTMHLHKTLFTMYSTLFAVVNIRRAKEKYESMKLALFVV